MVEIDSIMVEMEANVKNANLVKDIIFDTLLADGIIDETQYDLYCNDYQITIVKCGWFKSLIRKLGWKEDAWRYVYGPLTRKGQED